MKDTGVQFHEGIPESDDLRSWFPIGGFLVLDDLIGRWRQRVVGFILQTFSSSKYHLTVLVPRHDSTREILREYFQERPSHHSLQLGMRNLLLQAFPTCWRVMMVAYQKVIERPFLSHVTSIGPAWSLCQTSCQAFEKHKDLNAWRVNWKLTTSKGNRDSENLVKKQRSTMG